jgi:predicted RNA-binding Zn-ribbon protein involved in translation (DUF1610 family)
VTRKPRVIAGITDRTIRDWGEQPAGYARIPDDFEYPEGSFLVCSLKGDKRIPPAEDDADVSDVCADCGKDIVRRRSAPVHKNLRYICAPCSMREVYS